MDVEGGGTDARFCGILARSVLLESDCTNLN